MQQELNKCVIKGCTKEGKYRLIQDLSDKHYGYFCTIHQSELYYNNYPDLEGEGYNLTMSQAYSMIPCKICDNGTPCGNCKYEKIEGTWSYIGSKYERAGVIERKKALAKNTNTGKGFFDNQRNSGKQQQPKEYQDTLSRLTKGKYTSTIQM